MKPLDKLHERQDLTRWNRAGLRQFRYIDANAVTHLETLRQLLKKKFPHLAYPEHADTEQTTAVTHNADREDWLKHYYADRRDYGWEILRTFARGSHVLTEYINAYANECYLETANEWENVRRLVAMLGYQPAPPASAETWLALQWKNDAPAGKVQAGFSVKNQPAEDDPTITFETLEDIEGDALLNVLFPRDWNKAQTVGEESLSFVYEKGLHKGDWGILTVKGEQKSSAITISNINRKKNTFTIEIKDTNFKKNLNGYKKSDLTLLLKPDFIKEPLPYGKDVLDVGDYAGFKKNDRIFLKQKNNKTIIGTVKDVYRGRVTVDFNGFTKDDIKAVYVAHTMGVQPISEFGNLENKIVPSESFIAFLPDKVTSVYSKSKKEAFKPKEITVGKLSRKYVAGKKGEKFYYYLDGQNEIPVNKGNTQLLNQISFAGKNKSLFADDFLLIKTKKESTWSSADIHSVIQNTADFTLTFNNHIENIQTVQGDFQCVLRPLNHDRNTTPVWSNSGDYTAIPLSQKIEELSELLIPGRRLLVQGEKETKLVTIYSIINKDTLLVTPPFDNDPPAKNNFPRYSTRIYANVVKAGHGETLPQSILGSGDATEINQSFHLEMTDISFVSDSTFPTGVRADLSVTVDDRIWQQVPDLRLSNHEDHHYQVSIREDNSLTITFGDGRNGRRLPTGFDNVRVTYRTGSGTAGNLAAGELSEIARPHSLISDFKQLIQAAGGNDMEAADSMRTNAPAGVLVLERAVSLSDFTHLATRHSSVLQARAFSRMPEAAGTTAVEVVIVPPDGHALTDDQRAVIQTYLQQHSVPGLTITVKNFIPVYLSLKIRIQVDRRAWQPESVKDAVQKQLPARLSLHQRKLGQPLFRSEVVGMVEQVTGVENCVCAIGTYESKTDTSKNTKYTEKRITVMPGQLLYLNPKMSALTLSIVTEDFRQ